ncbi:DMT family transporter [Arcobacter sp. YIC-310]|uniref:DMT family transporter n=1 Tax=Arcobacter sp. YIC-310 TaxID=3376632 RepID=UPI003C2276BD
MTKSKLYEYRADLLLLTVAIVWGISFLMVQEAINTTPVYAFLFYRFALAAFLMFIIAYKFLKQTNMQTIIFGITLGIILFSAFATQTFGLIFTKTSIVAFITGLNVVCVPFLAYFIFKDHVRKNVFIASLIAVIGLYFLSMSGTLSLGNGEFLALICAVLFALHIIFTGKFSVKVNVFILVLVQFTTVAILSLLFSLYLDDKTFDLPYDYNFFKAVIVTAVFATVYAFLIQTYMQQFTTATKTAVIFTMEPVSAAIYGYFVGGEILSQIQIFGAVLIIVATLVAELRFEKINK